MQNYELLSLLGKGSYGKVYTARNKEDQQLYVLKRIPFDSASKSDADAAVREAQVLGLLRHPHIVPYKEFFNHDGDLCLVMALCDGGDLFQYVKALRKANKVVDEDLAWQWLVQLLLALSYCHSKKILHRDVKTQNIFMTKDGKLLLGDFGLAKQLQRTLEMARTPIGTPYYMAPEIYEEAPYSYKSDVWALGCVMYEALTGRPAFAADNLSRVVMRVLKGIYDPLPDIYSDSLRQIIGAMLQKDVKKRPNVNELLQHPRVLQKVQGYLDELSASGAQAGWSTWRMKLPPGLIVQMANIIAESQSRPSSAAAQSRPVELQPDVSELQVLQSQLNVLGRQSDDGDWEQESPRSGSVAAQQLLGTLNPHQPNRRSEAGNLTMKQLDLKKASTVVAAQPADLVGLSAALPKAGFGFAAAPRQSSEPAAPPQVVPLQAPAADPVLSPQSRVSASGTGAIKALHLAPLPGTAYQQPTSQGFTFKPHLAPIPSRKPQGKAGPAGQSINLQEALTKRATFLQQELELQLGPAVVSTACAAVRALHSTPGAVSDAQLREALSGKVSPAHLELAPLLDELVLLQRAYA